MRLRRFLLALGFALACVCVFAVPAFAKDYHIAEVNTTAHVGNDGSLQVTETRDWAFSGSFHWAEWVLDKSGTNGIVIEGVDGPKGGYRRATGGVGGTPAPGTYVVSDEADRVVVKVGFSAEDETLRIVLSYKTLGGVKRYKDTAELYWKAIGGEWTVPTDKVHVKIELPDGVKPDQVKTWAHGPLNGNVAIGGDAAGSFVTLDVTGLPAETFVEARVLFPAVALSAAPLIDRPRAAEVEREEATLAEQANARRLAAREELRRQEEAARRRRLVFGPLGIVFPFAVLGVVIYLWYRFGKEYKPDFPGGYYRDIPADYAPPLVGALWRMGQPEDRDIGATMMDLALKGAIYMKPVVRQEPGGFLGIGAHTESTYELTIDRAKIASADPSERDIATFLFDETMKRDTFTIEELRDEAKEHPQDFTSGLSAWKAAVAERANELGWIEKPGRAARVLALVLSFVAFITAIVCLFASQYWPVGFGILAAIAALLVSFLVTRRSRPAAELYAKYQGLERYMKDFGRMQEKPPSSVVLWEQYLVLAVVFGIAEEVIAQMRVAVPDVVNDPTFQTAYWWAYPAHGAGSSPVSSVSTGMASAVAAASSAMSSSSGGGGGFSGGGGGGFGGGGGSAG